jgi:RNase P subunit RPR2
LETRLCSLEDILMEIERVKAEEVERVKSVEARRKISKSTYLITFYCPKCLIRTYQYTNNELRTKAKKGIVPKCAYCLVELKVVDDEYREGLARLWEEYKSKVQEILKPIWKTLRNWWLTTDVEAMPCEIRLYPVPSATVKFEAPSHLKIYIEGGEVKAYMYLHWFEHDKMEKFRQVVEALRNAKVKALVEVDPRPDHCTVKREDMQKLGFKMGLFNWQMEIG